MVEDALPVIDLADLGPGHPRADATVHGIVLAAGASERYGDRNKLLVNREDEPIVRRAARPLLEADLDGVTVVLGHEAERVRAALAGLPVSFRTNDRYREGQGTSVAAGVATARERDADAVLIALGDMPDVSAVAIDRLLDAYRAEAGSALAAAFEGQRGNPVIFDRRHFEVLAELEGDRGGREILLSADEAAIVETADPGVLRDVDRPDDR